MTPEQALSILDQMAARVEANRADTLLAIQAVRTLSALIVPPDESELDPPEDP